jgi:hypothetical protein
MVDQVTKVDSPEGIESQADALEEAIKKALLRQAEYRQKFIALFKEFNSKIVAVCDDFTKSSGVFDDEGNVIDTDTAVVVNDVVIFTWLNQFVAAGLVNNATTDGLCQMVENAVDRFVKEGFKETLAEMRSKKTPAQPQTPGIYVPGSTGGDA